MTALATRRQFLRLAGSLVLGTAVAGCGRQGPDAEEVQRLAAQYDASLDCSDTTGLFPAEVQTRVDNEYTDRSTHETQFCFTCSNFERPDRPGSCGGCKTVKGPIQPLGWCKSWTLARSRA